jgi:exopolysaccharide biosynthesis polyprenyl glycosylphosphotransferase
VSSTQLAPATDRSRRETFPSRLWEPSRRRGWLVRRALAAADAIGLTTAFALAVWLFGDAPEVADRVSRTTETLLFLGTLPAWIVAAKLYGLYDRDEERTDHWTADDCAGVFHMVTVGAWIIFGGAWLTKLAAPQFDKVLGFWALAIVLVCTSRAGARAYCRRRAAYLQNTLIVGAGDLGRLVATKYQRHPEYGITLVGFVDADGNNGFAGVDDLPLLGTPDQLADLVRQFDVERVVVAVGQDAVAGLSDVIHELRGLDLQIDLLPQLYEVVDPRMGLHTVEGLPLIGLGPQRLARSSHLLKRSLDLVFGTLGVVLFAPLALLIAVAIKLDSPGPVFFRQVRMGANGTFRMWKLRTMSQNADERKNEVAHLNKHLAPGGDPRMFKIDGDPRVTRVGRLLRRFSFDELPQLLNVVAGDMSLVGPRPLILGEDGQVTEAGRRRLQLRPGITGLWQVLGRDDIPFEEMVRLDCLYVTTWSLWGDIRIMLRTIVVVARRSG